MPQVRLVLSQFLQQHGLQTVTLVEATQHEVSRNTIYRLLRDETSITRIDFPTLAALIAGLQRVTGKPVGLADILEFDAEAVSLPTTRKATGGA